MKSLLGFKAKGRDIVKGDEGYHLREEAAPYMAPFEAEKGDIDAENTYFGDTNTATVAFRASGRTIEIRTVLSPKLHDRYILDDKRMLILGTSLNGVGKKASLSLRLPEYGRPCPSPSTPFGAKQAGGHRNIIKRTNSFENGLAKSLRSFTSLSSCPLAFI